MNFVIKRPSTLKKNNLPIFKTSPNSGIFNVCNLYDKIRAFHCRRIAYIISTLKIHHAICLCILTLEYLDHEITKPTLAFGTILNKKNEYFIKIEQRITLKATGIQARSSGIWV